MKLTKKKVEEAKQACIEVLKRVMEWKATDKWIPYIELWSIGPWSIRVAELGSVATDGNSGAACMQSDPPSAAICFATERWLLHFLWGKELGHTKLEDLTQEMESLEWCMKEAWKA